MTKEKIKITFREYFWIFVVCSFLGTIYEEVLHMVRYFWIHHKFHWSRRSGLFFTPLSPVYGLGAVLFLFVLGRKQKGKGKVYFGAAILGGMAEYVMSLVQEWLTGTTSWDYSDKFLNIQGRTTVIYMLGWGMAGLVLIKWLYPRTKDFLERFYDRFRVASRVLVCIVLADVLISWSALARRELRHRNIPSFTFVGKFYDEYYTDEFVEECYPNMQEKEDS